MQVSGFKWLSYLSVGRVVLLMVALMSGVLSILREVLALYSPERFTGRLPFWRFVWIAFIISVLFAWALEHNQNLQLRESLDILTRPNISGEVTFTSLASTEGQTVLVLAVDMVNKGAPSVVKFERCIITLSNGEEVQAQLILPPISDVSIEGSGNTPNLVLRRSDFLPGKGSEQPVASGGGLSGWAMFVIPGVARDTMATNSTKISYLSRDINGAEISIDAVMGQRGTSSVYLGKGTKQPL